MNKTHFTDLATFNCWANKKICDFIAANLTAEMVDREIGSSFPSVRKTLYHVWDAEAIWLQRLNGISKGKFPSDNFIGTFEEGARKFMDNSNELLKKISLSDDSFFQSSITFTVRSGKEYTQEVKPVLTHVINHSTFHRGQLITMFRQLGFTTGIPETDFIEYYREMMNQ
ncbi:MAG: DinB family protein [Bacteroidota bacterium]